MTLFNATPHNNFYTSIGSRLYNTQAPQNAIFPFAVFAEESDMNEYTFTTNFENVQYRFDLFSTDESMQEIGDMFTYCKALFDWCRLTIDNYTHLYMRREGANLIKDDRPAWQLTVNYMILSEET